MRWTILLLFLIFLGCSTGKKESSGDIVSPRFALKRAFFLNQSIKTLHGNARISVEGSEEAQSFDAEVFYKAPDSLLIRIEYLLGADAAVLAILKNRYIFYNKINDNFLAGDVGDPFVDAFFKLPIPLHEFSDLLVAKFPLDSTFSHYEVSRLDESYLFDQKNGLNSWYYNIGLNSGRVRRLEIYDHENELLLAEEFANFEMIKSLTFPRRIVLKRPQTRQYVGVFYSTLELNEPIPDDVFNVVIPSSTKQLDLGF